MVVSIEAPVNAMVLHDLNGRWRIHPQKTEEIQPHRDTDIMQYKSIFDRMYIDINLEDKIINFGITNGDSDIVDIESITEEDRSFIFYIEHDPVRLTPQEGGLLRYEEESSGTFLVLIKQLSSSKKHEPLFFRK